MLYWHYMEYIIAFKLFLVPMLVMAVAQLIKWSRFTYRHGFSMDYAFAPGHFPSAHSAFVTSLVVIIGFYYGVESPAFAVAAAFALITIYDAMRVRVNIGLQGRALNMLVAELDEIDKDKFPHLKERVGHYANEVAGGIAVGTILTLLIIYVIEVV